MATAAELVARGGEMLARGDVDAAFEAGRAAVAAAPLDPSALWFAAQAAEAALSPECLVHWARLDALVPDVPVVALRRARAALDAADPVQALGVLERLAGRPDLLASLPPELRLQFAFAAQRAGAPALAAGFARAAPGGGAHAGLLEWVDRTCAGAGALVPADTDLLLALVGWGESFAGIFARLVLPALLSAGNLPALVAGRRAALLTIGDDAFRARLDADPLAARLDALVRRVHVPVPPDVLAGNLAINVYGPVQMVGFRAAQARGCDFVLLHCDLFYGAGALGFLRRTGDAGALAFCTQAFSAGLEPMEAALEALRAPDGTLAVPPRRLMSLAFAAMHPRSAAMVVRADRPSLPTHATVFLHADPGGLRLRALQPSPMWVSRAAWPGSLPLVYDTQDNGLIHRLVPDPAALDRIVFGAPGDAFAVVELTSLHQGVERTSALAIDGPLDAAIARLAVAGRLLDPLRLRAHGSESFLRGDVPPPWSDAPDPRPLIDAAGRRLAETLYRHRAGPATR